MREQMTTATIDTTATSAFLKDPASDSPAVPPDPTGVTYAVQALPPLELDWRRIDTGVVVRDVPTGIFGVGPDVSSALADAMVAVREHLDVLRRQPHLSADLRAQFEYLSERIR
jgi:hypothetical protein